MLSFLFAIVFYTLVLIAAISGNSAAVTAVCTVSVLYFLMAAAFYGLILFLLRATPTDRREHIQLQIDVTKPMYQPKFRLYGVCIDFGVAGVIATFAPWFAAAYAIHTILLQLITDRLIHTKRGEWR